MFVSTNNPSTITNTHSIYHTPYPSDQRQEKKQIIQEKLRLTKISFIKTFLCILCFIAITIVGIWGSIYLYELAIFNFKGECIVVDKAGCDYELQIYMSSICDDKYNPDHIFDTRDTDCEQYYAVNEIIPCYTNAKCGKLSLNDDTDSGYVVAGIVVNIATICTMIITMYGIYMAWIICHCHVTYKPVYVIMECTDYWLERVWPVSHRYDKWVGQRLMNGREKQLYNVTEWKRLTDSQKVNYFLSYCTREYNLNLYENIGDMLLEYMKKPQTHTVNQQSVLSKRQIYLNKTMKKQYDLH